MDSFVAELKQKVLCVSCEKTMVSPKLLECFHTVCKECIKSHLKLNEENQFIFDCVQCSSQAILQDPNDVEVMQDNPVHSRIVKVLDFLKNEKACSISSSHEHAFCHCLDCNESLCEECLRCHSKLMKQHHVVSMSELQNEEIELMIKREKPCEIHGNEDVELYCDECKSLVCRSCLKDQHHNHKTSTIQDFIASKTDSMSNNLQQIAKMSSDEKEMKQQEEIAGFFLNRTL